MTHPPPRGTLECFRRAGHGHMRSAEHVLEKFDASNSTIPATIPASAAYLAHVALECAMKARLLSRGAYPSVEVLAEKAPGVHAALFTGKKGHNLGELARQLRLAELVATEGRQWSDDPCWKRIASSERPYSLRYGVERMEKPQAAEELKRASELLEVLLAGLDRPPLPRRNRRAR